MTRGAGRRPGAAYAIAALAMALASCNRRPILTEQADARRIAAELHVHFTKAVEAGNRAVMADTDEGSTAAAMEARTARAATRTAATALQPLIGDLGEADAATRLREFVSRFGEYETLDDDVLGLAVENTNLKAQRLSFGPAAQSAEDLRAALSATSAAAGTKEAQLLAARIMLAVRTIQFTEARHIAEAEEAGMDTMEAAIAQEEQEAATMLDALSRQASARAQDDVGRASSAFARFRTENRDVMALSRRNSNVRSLALALGRKRMLTAECEDELQSLQDALAAHQIRATR